MIISFSHNDLDALGCELCIAEKYNDISYVNTNYKNIEEKTSEVINLIPGSNGLFITDICFNEHIKLLTKIKKQAELYSVPVYFIDHHIYEDLTNIKELNFDYFIVDTHKCASVLVSEYLNVSDALKELCLDIQSFDIWQDKSPRFKRGLCLNAYYWEKFMNNGFRPNYIHHFFYPKLFSDFTKVSLEYFKSAIDYLENNKKMLIKNNNILYALIDEHYITLQLKEFKQDTDVILIFTTYGKVMIRINKKLIDKADAIKKIFMDDSKGHKLAFSLDKTFKSMQEIQHFIEIIHPSIVSVLKGA